MLTIMQLVVCDAALEAAFSLIFTVGHQSLRRVALHSAHGVHHILGVNDVVATEHCSRFVS
jgi:hypothetical protein